MGRRRVGGGYCTIRAEMIGVRMLQRVGRWRLGQVETDCVGSMCVCMYMLGSCEGVVDLWWNGVNLTPGMLLGSFSTGRL